MKIMVIIISIVLLAGMGAAGIAHAGSGELSAWESVDLAGMNGNDFAAERTVWEAVDEGRSLDYESWQMTGYRPPVNNRNEYLNPFDALTIAAYHPIQPAWFYPPTPPVTVASATPYRYANPYRYGGRTDVATFATLNTVEQASTDLTTLSDADLARQRKVDEENAREKERLEQRIAAKKLLAAAVIAPGPQKQAAPEATPASQQPATLKISDKSGATEVSLPQGTDAAQLKTIETLAAQRLEQEKDRHVKTLLWIAVIVSTPLLVAIGWVAREILKVVNVIKQADYDYQIAQQQERRKDVEAAQPFLETK